MTKDQKQFLPSNFRLEIDGLDCTKVNKIDAFTVKQTVAGSQVGASRDFAKTSSKVEFPNLKISIAASAAESWQKWFESFVVQGRNDDGSEKSGKLVLLSANRADTLAEIKLQNMGIFALRQANTGSAGDNVNRLEAELYVERMEFIPIVK
jgi:hypothetical protein